MDIFEKETIYKKHYPKVCFSESQSKKSTDSQNVQTAYESFCARLADRMRKPDDPDKLALVDGAIKEAIEMSEAYQIDTRIERGHGYVNITLSFDYCAFTGELMAMFSKILFIADDCGFFHIPGTGKDITLSIGYQTN